jgi:diadenosine tetraphosphatase ApaH/serine/threonine PP2A family protein phosphatase
VQIEGEFTLAHGSLRDPIWDYLISPGAAEEHLSHQTTPYGLVGHSHLPHVYTKGQTRLIETRVEDGEEVSLGRQHFVANPGSVGQPRDGDPRAAYGLIDTERRLMTFHRVAYDIEVTQAKIAAVGLPDYLASRLAEGR